ncbi:HEAT repeat domain-containing protein [Reinekea thalattae]|uniref:HEAT repeat domain-containing protein n=1 Tax=Reinekea thalattae TaxID=2593301 RepID=A0A5C8Z9U7_9GAMM|nr:HEAT repeat domain-containing protein [Reinekea thalattae]TXR54875.1 HEAT repeat domain-containing protein [Reinekea thalattae]
MVQRAESNGTKLGNTAEGSRYDEMYNYLEEILINASSHDEIITALKALYNAKLEHTLELISEYTDHSNQEVRLESFELIVNIGTEESWDFISKNISLLSDNNVTNGVLAKISTHIGKDYINDWLIESNSYFSYSNSTKDFLVKYVDSNTPVYSENQTALLNLENRISSTDDLKILYKYIPPTM